MNAFTLAMLAATSAPAQPIAPVPISSPAVAPAPPAVAPTQPVVSFWNKRIINVPVDFKPEKLKTIKEALLFVSRDGGEVYEIGDRIDPSQKTAFNYATKEDGEYWVQLQLVFRDGTLDPKNPRALPPAEKIVIDTAKPVVTILTAEMAGEEAIVEWRIDDKHPADANTRLWYKQTGPDNTAWQEVPASAISKRTARFKPVVSGPITLNVTTADLAGNVGGTNRDVKGPITTVAGSGTGAAPVPPVALDAPAPPTSLANKEPLGPAPSGPLPPPNLTADPPPSAAPAPPRTAPVAPGFTPPEPTRPAAEAPRPIASSNAPPPAGWAAPPPPPAPEPTAPQFSRTPRFDLNYTLDSGASGVARVDLYVTRDDGRSWVRWSQHDGRETPLKVVLDTRFNKELEGDYGFALVPVSGAGLSEGAPQVGTAPELKVRLDTTAPVIKVYAPTADPNNKAALVLNWEATDKNFGRDPIAVEYAESPQGPWKNVTGTDGPAAARLENTGSYSWQPPLNLATPKVYLRFTAWDLAGNKSEVVTPNPILVDLTKPKARIQGITAGPGR
ncbi:MAG: hypothetical protein MUF18_10435 [Fimbriiglobus sp.]|jgi:hypothetical protein|nr:hypothetical protein [Fimbriiglobus sp.]